MISEALRRQERFEALSLQNQEVRMLRPQKRQRLAALPVIAQECATRRYGVNIDINMQAGGGCETPEYDGQIVCVRETITHEEHRNPAGGRSFGHHEQD